MQVLQGYLCSLFFSKSKKLFKNLFFAGKYHFCSCNHNRLQKICVNASDLHVVGPWFETQGELSCVIVKHGHIIWKYTLSTTKFFLIHYHVHCIRCVSKSKMECKNTGTDNNAESIFVFQFLPLSVWGLYVNFRNTK